METAMVDLVPLPESQKHCHDAKYSSRQMRSYAAACVAAYKATLIRELENRHMQHINQHNWYACLARELREGEL